MTLISGANRWHFFWTGREDQGCTGSSSVSHSGPWHTCLVLCSSTGCSVGRFVGVPPCFGAREWERSIRFALPNGGPTELTAHRPVSTGFASRNFRLADKPGNTGWWFADYALAIEIEGI